MLTWSLGCTGFLLPSCPPSSSIALLLNTSFMFMLLCVPDPVCHITKGKCSDNFPCITCVKDRGKYSLHVTKYVKQML